MQVSLVVSDFHVGAGRYLADGTPNPLEVFHEDKRFIEFLEHYSSDTVGPGKIELVLNGDFFNLLQIGYEEPKPTRISEKRAVQMLDRVIEGHKELFAALSAFASMPKRKVFCMLGNHDPGLIFDAVKKRVQQRIPGNWEFSIDPRLEDGVFIEHGNQYDPFNRHEPNRLLLTKGLAEPILNLPWGSYFLIRFVNRIKEERPYIDLVKPFGLYMRWSLLNDFWWGLWTRFRAGAFFLASLLSPRGALPGFLATLKLFMGLGLAGRDPDQRAARKILKRPDVHTVILGHFHKPVFLRLGPGRSYINTGTWNKIISLDPGSLGARSCLTYALVERENGKARAILKEWLGKSTVDREFE